MTYTIYRLKDIDENVIPRFMGSESLKKFLFWPPKPESYEPIWREDIPGKVRIDLEDVFTKFNLAHPEGFNHYSLSVGDIIVTGCANPGAYLCDSFGWTELPDFYAAVTEENV